MPISKLRAHYNVMCDKQLQMGEGYSVAQLSFILWSLPNLQRIGITDGGTVPKDRIRGRDPGTSIKIVQFQDAVCQRPNTFGIASTKLVPDPCSPKTRLIL